MNEVRLIDANALIEEFKKHEDRNGYLKADWEVLIGNAPTVDLWQMRQEATENALKKAEVLYGRPQGEYETACNVLLSLEQIVRSSDGWEDSAVESVHNAVQTAIKCMHERPQGEWIPEENTFTDLNGIIETYTRFKCSICNQGQNFGEYPFCCWCGAKMEGIKS